MTLNPKSPRAKRRWLALGVMLAALSIALGAVTLAVHDQGLFELDKDATDGKNSDPAGFLASSINNAATTTSLNVCQILTYGTAPAQITYPVPVAGETILIEAEQMTLTANNSGSFGGSCAGSKRIYTVVRAATATRTAHAGGEQKIEARVSVIRAAVHPEGPDWDTVRQTESTDPDCSSIGLLECAFIEDGIGPSIFTIGSTKDHLPLEGWFHTSGGSPDKGEILNAYAAKDEAPDGTDLGTDPDQVLYFGMDRWAVDGSTDIGFWFFQDQVVACPDPTAPAGACEGVPDGEFAGSHVAGDVLILGTFTQGGATSDIRVFQWVVSGGNEQENIEGPTGAFGDCVPGATGDFGCATVNNTSILVPWTYTFKGSAKSGWIPAGGFFEGGVNLSAIGLEGCFSSFLAETRSSPSITAILKDFALGGFEACDTGLVTTPSDENGDALTDSDDPVDGIPDIQIGTGAAGVDVTDVAELDVSGTGAWSGTLDFYLCGPILETELCEEDGTLVDSQEISDADGTTTYTSDSAHLTSVGYYCWRGEFLSDTQGVPDATDASVGECFEVTPVTPTITTNATVAVEVGTAITDTATIAGTANQPGDPIINGPDGAAANGTITFNLYGPGDATCEDDLIYTKTVDVTNGDGTYGGADGLGTDDVTYTPTDPGTYRWIASYSGDGPNTLGASGACNDANESTLVVDARISIEEDDTNEVGVPHTFTVTVEQNTGSGWENAPDGTPVTVTLTATNGAVADISENTCVVTPGVPPDPDTGGTVNGQCSVTFTSDTAGKITGHATVTFSVGGVSVTRSTDGTGGNSDDAVKFFVDAQIDLSPLTATNEVNVAHEITATVQQDDGRAAADPLGDGVLGWAPAPDGTPVTFSLLNNTANAAFTGTPPVSTCTTTSGECSVFINTSTAGSVDIHATTTFDVGGVSLTRATGTGGNNSADANKVYVDARISIAEDDTNEVGVPHTFTVTVEQNTGSGWENAPDGTPVTVTLTATNGAVVDAATLVNTCVLTGDDPETAGTQDGECSVTFTSNTAGKITGHASVTFSVGGVSLTRSTDGTGGNSDDAVKFFVDAQIDLSPLTATNEVNVAHEITATVQQDDGRAAADPLGDGVLGWAPAPDGTPVTFSLLNNTANAAFTGTPPVSTCTTTSGECSVFINTSTAGSVDIHATTTFDVGGVSLTRATGTGGNNSADANKVYVDAYITIGPEEETNFVGEPHTFTVNVFQDDGLATGGDGVDGWAAAPDGTHVTVLLTDTLGADSSVSSDTCAVVPGVPPDPDTGGTLNGACTVTFTSPTAGTVTGHASVSFPVGGVTLFRETDGIGLNSGDAVKHFISLQPTMDTAQQFVPNDSATITVASGGGDLEGTVVFKLYVDNDTCTGDADYTSSAIDITTGSGTGLSRTVMSGNETAYSTDGTTFHWVVEYSSDKLAHEDVTSGCGNEHSSITIDNGVQQPVTP